jgi:O-antigen/teichoic acid export membrane protein
MSSARLRHNILYNLVGSGIPILVTIATVPLYIQVVGEARYGVLALLWTVFGYFGLFDFGLSRATAHRLATLRGAPLKERASVFYTACVLNIAFGLVAAVVLYVSAEGVLSLFAKESGDLHSEIVQVLPLIVAFFPLGLIGGVFAGCLESNERFLELNAQQVAGSVLWQCLPLALVYFVKADLQHAVLGAVVARGLSTAWQGWTCLSWAAPAGRPSISRRYLKDLLRYGGWTTVTNAISPLLTSIDQFIIGALLGPRAVAHYNVPYGIATKALIPPAAFTRALFPRLAHYSEAEAQDLCRTSLLLISGLMAAACAPAVLLARFALELWVGREFAAASHAAAELLIIGVWVNGVTLLPYTLLQARNRPDVIAKLHALEIIPFLVIVGFAITMFGLPGAAAAWGLRVTIDGVLLFRASRLGWRVVFDLIAPALSLVLALIAAVFVQPDLPAALGWSVATAMIPLGWIYLRRREVMAIASRASPLAADAPK